MAVSSNTLNPSSISESSELNSWRPLKIYAYYRLFVSLLLLFIYHGNIDIRHLGSFDSDLYFSILNIYLILNLTTLFLGHQRRLKFKQQAFLDVFLDLLCLTLFVHASGGLTSSLSILLVVAVTAGSILIVGRLSTFLAALAAIAVIFEEIYFSLLVENSPNLNLTQAGTLGIAFFAAAFLSHGLSSRLRASQAIASKSQSDFFELQKLNNHIIQRMRTGIIALSEQGKIQIINESAIQLLNCAQSVTGIQLSDISSDLNDRMEAWLLDSNNRSTPFRAILGGPEITCNFTQWSEGTRAGTLIFIDDKTQMAQQAQQLKLASLGTLTAGIAHEIRNPLGAISHAAQLLKESPDLVKADSRLAEIIQQHSVRMNEIVENVLQLSRRSPSQFSLYNMLDWLEQFLRVFSETQEEEIDVRLKIFPKTTEIRIDSSQLTQVLTNLCQNGLRYSKQNTGKSVLYLYGHITEQGRPVLDIVDQGEGISPQKAEHVFEPFYTTESSGTGLGLYIARELCEANHARLDALPAANGGCCMRITFSHPGRIVQ